MINVEHNQNIRKVIHYCWFGRGPLPKIAIKCIDSWKKHLPDYSIVRWDENNFDITSNLFAKEAYGQKKFAFVSDYVRLFVLYKYGGIYMDTDVEVVNSLDRFLDNDAFSGFESKRSIPTGIMGAKKGSEIIKTFLDYYENRSFFNEDGTFDTKTNVRIITDICVSKGFIPNNKFQIFKGLTLYPKTYFCPLEWNNKRKDFSEETCTIHHFAGSWHDEKDEKRKKSFFWRNFGKYIGIIIKITKFILGDSSYNKIKKIIKSFI